MILSFLAGITATPVFAHPHVFVETAVAVIYENNTPIAVRLEWTYDDFFSLLLTADLGIDQDGDGVLTPEETDILVASVKKWPAGFEGDLEVLQDEKPLALGPREDHRVTFENGIMREIHTRPLISPTSANLPLVVRPYDLYFYVAYDVTDDLTTEGRDACVGVLEVPDEEAAKAVVVDLLDGRSPSDVGPTEEFPAVGNLFAQTVTFTCAD